MNYSKIIFFLSLSLIGIVGTHSTAFAVTTEGKINFTEGDGETTGPIKLIKPGTEKEVITIAENLGNRTTGGLRFSFVPNLNFGEAEISVVDQVYYAKPIPYKLSDTNSQQTEFYMPPFVQVVNESGKDHQFSVYVWATPFKSNENHELAGSRIKLSDFSGRNTSLDTGSKEMANEGYGNIDAVLSGWLNTANLNNFPDKVLTIPTNKSDAAFIFSSENGEKTRGNASSVVFGKDYSPKTNYLKEDRMKSIALHIPATDKPKKADYFSTITWELEDTIR